MAKICVFFRFYLFFWLYQKNTAILAISWEFGGSDLSYKLGKLVIQIKDDYYINWKNTKIGKMNVFHVFALVYPTIFHCFAQREHKWVARSMGSARMFTFTS